MFDLWDFLRKFPGNIRLCPKTQQSQQKWEKYYEVWIRFYVKVKILEIYTLMYD